MPDLKPFYEVPDEANEFEGQLGLAAYDIHQWAVRKGFWEEGVERNIPEQLALMHSELSEALEALRHGGGPADTWANPVPEGFGVELADCVIRILDTCAAYEIPLGRLIVEKMRYNEGRLRKHGKAF